jgi:hypothetical protein
MKSNELGCLAAFLLVLWSGAGHAQPSAQNNTGAQSRIVTTTRLVAQFSELEREWLKALASRDQTVLDGLMGEDFQEWNPQSSDPVPREDWLRARLGAVGSEARIQQMAVRDLGSVALVSFLLSAQAGQWFVVDVWQRQGEQWQVTDRYASPVAGGVRVPVLPSGKR